MLAWGASQLDYFLFSAIVNKKKKLLFSFIFYFKINWYIFTHWWSFFAIPKTM
jgi:hypothetical protein